MGPNLDEQKKHCPSWITEEDIVEIGCGTSFRDTSLEIPNEILNLYMERESSFGPDNRVLL